MPEVFFFSRGTRTWRPRPFLRPEHPHGAPARVRVIIDACMHAEMVSFCTSTRSLKFGLPRSRSHEHASRTRSVPAQQCLRLVRGGRWPAARGAQSLERQLSARIAQEVEVRRRRAKKSPPARNFEMRGRLSSLPRVGCMRRFRATRTLRRRPFRGPELWRDHFFIRFGLSLECRYIGMHAIYIYIRDRVYIYSLPRARASAGWGSGVIGRKR